MASSSVRASERGDIAPYLSVVVTSRNDGHGGDPLARLQAFINTFDAQCRRFRLDAEVIVVEWNPPAERPRLHQVIHRPEGCSFPLRFIEVPRPLHDRLPRAHVLPLFQMIGKNAGIRRARGRFVLATNIDIIFSNDLVEFFGAGKLRPGVMYRVDRHDIESSFPIEATLESQMAYCQSHHLRIHRSSGTYPVDRHGHLVPLSADVFSPPAVTIGDGWHMREGESALGYYRWATERASLIVDRGAEDRAGGLLALDVEPNPYDPASWVEIEVADLSGVLGRARITDRRLWCVPLSSASRKNEIVLRTVAASPERSLPAFERRSSLNWRLRSVRLTYMPLRSEQLHPHALNQVKAPHRDVTARRTEGGLVVDSARARGTYCLRYGPLFAPRDGVYAFVVNCSCLEGHISLHAVDELADRWIPSEQFEMVEGDHRQMFLSLTLKRAQGFSLYMANRFRGGDGVSRFVVHSLGGSVTPDELQFSPHPMVIFRATQLAAAKLWRRAMRGIDGVSRLTDAANADVVVVSGDENAAPSVSATALDDLGPTARIERYLKQHRPTPVHRNAAGDFQLMAREHWFEIHGYPEFTMYSMNVDGLLGDIAHHAGVVEEILPMPIYHLEHAEGSGWTPEGEGLLRKRLADSGADWLDATTVDLWSGWMDWLKRPMIFNGSDWGVGDAVLHETTLQTVGGV
jgi:hypothetical protein